MMKDIALFSIGFSLISAVILILAHLSSAVYADMKRVRIPGILLTLNLILLQLMHYAAISGGNCIVISAWTTHRNSYRNPV